jgi:tripartite-type tricarboxylate transporter receptor subunit TctC
MRSTLFPELPTIAEAGVPGYDASGWNALLAPRATPRDLVLRIHATLLESLHSPRVKETLTTSGAEAVGNTPEEFSRFLQGEMAKWGKVVRAAGIRENP